MNQTRNLFINIFLSMFIIFILGIINIGVFSLFNNYKSIDYLVLVCVVIMESLLLHGIASIYTTGSKQNHFWGFTALVMLILMGISKILGRIKKINSAKYSVYALCEENVVNIFYFNKFYFLMSNNDIIFNNDVRTKEKIIYEIEHHVNVYTKKPKPEKIDMFKNWNGSLDEESNRKTKIDKIIK